MAADGEDLSLIPGKDHYDGAYLGSDFARMFSYQTQISMAIRGITPARVLVVGVGDGLVVEALRRSCIDVITLDISSELNPDLVASVEAIPMSDRAVDVTICCQVLEHIPFESVRTAVRELCRVTASRLIVSVPDQRRYVGARFSVLGRKFSLAFNPPRLRPHKFEEWRRDTMGHFWEVGFREWPVKRVRPLFEVEGWENPILHRVPDMPWHLFLELNRISLPAETFMNRTPEAS